MYFKWENSEVFLSFWYLGFCQFFEVKEKCQLKWIASLVQALSWSLFYPSFSPTKYSELET